MLRVSTWEIWVRIYSENSTRSFSFSTFFGVSSFVDRAILVKMCVHFFRTEIVKLCAKMFSRWKKNFESIWRIRHMSGAFESFQLVGCWELKDALKRFTWETGQFKGIGAGLPSNVKSGERSCFKPFKSNAKKCWIKFESSPAEEIERCLQWRLRRAGSLLLSI